MYRLILIISILISIPVVCLAGDDKHPKNDNEGSYIEATVVIGSNNCGYLLQLSNGQLIKPANLPKKFQHYYTKVMVLYDETKELTDSPCDATKEVNITEIKSCKAKHKAQGKF